MTTTINEAHHGHLPTDRLLSVMATALCGLELAPLHPAHPRIDQAEVVGDAIRVTYSYYPPLDQGPDRRTECRDLRITPPMLMDVSPGDAVLDESVVEHDAVESETPGPTSEDATPEVEPSPDIEPATADEPVTSDARREAVES